MMMESTFSNSGKTWLRRLAAVVSLSSGAQAAILSSLTQTRHFRAREHIMRDGARDGSVQVLLRGFAYRHRYRPDGTRQITAFLVPGDICDFGFLSHSTVSQNVIALPASSVGQLDLSQLAGMVEKHPEIMTGILRCAAIEQSTMQELLVSVGGRTALHRVAHMLCEMHYRLSKVDLVDAEGSFGFPLTQSELGDALGLSTVHINRKIQVLRREGLAIWRDKTITLPDPQALRALCSFDPTYLRAGVPAH